MNPTNKSSIVAKCVGIVDLLADGNRAMGFTEIVERSGLVKSSAHRILGILVSEKLIELNPGDKKYWLGPKMMNWAVSVWHHADIQQAVTNELDELAESCRHNVALAVLGDKGVLYLRTVETYQLRYVPKAGEQAPLHCSAVGKAIAAFQPKAKRNSLIAEIDLEKFTENTIIDRQVFAAELEQVVKDGFAKSDGEEFLKVCGIACPVFDIQGRVAGSICIWSQTDKATLRDLEKLVPQLATATRQISENLGYLSK